MKVHQSLCTTYLRVDVFTNPKVKFLIGGAVLSKKVLQTITVKILLAYAALQH